MRIIFLGILSILFCVACSEQHDHKGKTPLVELDGNFLYQEDLQSALPARLSKDDSLLFAEHYIRNWVEDILLYEKAQSNIPDNGGNRKISGELSQGIDNAHLSTSVDSSKALE